MILIIISFFIPNTFADTEMDRIVDGWRVECEKKSSDTKEINACIDDKQRQYDSLKSEKSADPAQPKEPPKACMVDSVRSACDSALGRAQKALAKPCDGDSCVEKDEYVKKCLANCANAPWVENKIEGCGNLTKQKTIEYLVSKRPYCQKPGSGRTNNAETADDDDAVDPKEQGLPACDGTTLFCDLNKAPPGGFKYEIPDPTVPTEVNDPKFGAGTCVGTYTFSVSTCQKPLADASSCDGVGSLNRETCLKNLATQQPSYFYKDMYGQSHATYAEANSANLNYYSQLPTWGEGDGGAPAITGGRDTGGTPGGGSLGAGAGSAGNTTRDTGAASKVTSTDQSGGGGSGSGSGGAQQPTTGGPQQTGQQQQQAGGQGQQAAAGSGSGGSSSSGGNFNNPYGNSGLNLNNSGNAGRDSQAAKEFAALSQDRDKKYLDEGVSSDGSSRSSGGDYSSSSSRGYSGGGSEGVNRGVAPSSMASRTPVDSQNTKVSVAGKNGSNKLDSLQTASFNSGYHKAPGKESLSGQNGKKRNGKLGLARNKKQNRKTKGACKAGDTLCVASLMSGSMNRKGKHRGLASAGGALPKGVWKGYSDILSHMATVHDKMPIDESGTLDDIP